MPVRATKRGAQRTPLQDIDYDVLICGASFAGLTVARELAPTNARILVLDRYEIGERQTSACAAPSRWLKSLSLGRAIRQDFCSLQVNTPGVKASWVLPEPFSTFDYSALCEDLWGQRGPDTQFDTATVTGRTNSTVHTDRGDIHATIVVDCLGWRRVLGHGPNVQPPHARLSRGLEVHPAGAGSKLEIWIDRKYVPAGYGWCFPAGNELRIGIGSFDPHFHVKEPTLRLLADLEQEPEGYQGNWIPHQLRPATEDGVFFVGDSAGHCLPLTAEGIRTAFYFALACGRELRYVLEGKQNLASARERYHKFSDDHAWAFRWLLRTQRLIPRLHPRLLGSLAGAAAHPTVSRWMFQRYLAIAAPPSRHLPHLPD